jgi:hypothetical protein
MAWRCPYSAAELVNTDSSVDLAQILHSLCITRVYETKAELGLVSNAQMQTSQMKNGFFFVSGKTADPGQPSLDFRYLENTRK